MDADCQRLFGWARDNGELVVDTIGITPGLVTAGGWRTVETGVTERFVVSPDGKHLTIDYRWQSPAIYHKPHEYRYEFDRLPAGSYAPEYWCDARPRGTGVGHTSVAVG